jgi:hypothetical protein
MTGLEIVAASIAVHYHAPSQASYNATQPLLQYLARMVFN